MYSISYLPSNVKDKIGKTESMVPSITKFTNYGEDNWEKKKKKKKKINLIMTNVLEEKNWGQ